MTYNTQTPFLASFVIFEKAGKFAFVLRENTDWMNNHYGLPSGKVEVNESFLQAAIREAKEEVGIVLKTKNLEIIHIMHRDEKSKQARLWVDVYFRASNWDGELVNAEPHIHSKLEWLDPKNLPTNVIPSVTKALESILIGQFYSEYGWSAN